jgi:plasmid replication initiation protein
LYELLAQWQSVGKREVELDWLKQQFEIEDLYPDMCDLKKRVIDPAIKDINTHSNFEVTWEQRKTGRKVTHLTFTFNEKKLVTPEKSKRVTKPKEKMYFGVAKSEIDKLARTGESYEDAAARINKAKECAKTTIQEPKKTTEPKKPTSKETAVHHIKELKNVLKTKTSAV